MPDQLKIKARAAIVSSAALLTVLPAQSASAGTIELPKATAFHQGRMRMMPTGMSSSDRQRTGASSADVAAAAIRETHLTDADLEMMHFAMSAPVEEIDFSRFFLDEEDE